MKNKIIINILLAYFLILSIVLFIQVSSKQVEDIKPLATDMATEEKLKNAVVLAINSPVAIVNQNQLLIDNTDSTLVPTIYKSKVYIPAKLLKTAFNADISFSKNTKETTIRLDNKAMIFSNNNASIKVLDNTTEQTVEIEAKSKIINDRFYIPLRCLSDVFNKQIFYNSELIIISDVPNIFDPIEEMETIDNLLKQVKQLPIVGNEENLKDIVSRAKDSEVKSIEPIKELIKKTNNYNIYLRDNFIEVYFVRDKKETFSFKVERMEDKIYDIIITDDRFIVSYEHRTFIYDISKRDNIETYSVIENNGYLYKNIIDENNFYNICKLDISYNKENLPRFSEYLYNYGNIEKLIDKKLTFNDIFYFPDMNDKKYTLITYINLYEKTENLSNIAFVGMGNNFIVNEDILYILTSNKENNNLYQFKATLDDIQYTNKVSFKGEVLGMEFDREKQFLSIKLKDKNIYFDNSLIQR